MSGRSFWIALPEAAWKVKKLFGNNDNTSGIQPMRVPSLWHDPSCASFPLASRGEVPATGFGKVFAGKLFQSLRVSSARRTWAGNVFDPQDRWPRIRDNHFTRVMKFHILRCFRRTRKQAAQRRLASELRLPGESRHESLRGWLVPEARLELANLAAEDFESPASTIPPLGPPEVGLPPWSPGVNASEIVRREGVAVGQLAGLEPDHEPA